MANVLLILCSDWAPNEPNTRYSQLILFVSSASWGIIELVAVVEIGSIVCMYSSLNASDLQYCQTHSNEKSEGP